MKDANNDPVKKAGLIRDIVTSISKIPDSIQREVYVQECSRIMEISERVLFSELAQLISKNSQDYKKNQQKEKQSFEVIKKQTEQLKEVNSLFILEREIIRILLLFGNQETDFVDFIEVEDEDGVIVGASVVVLPGGIDFRTSSLNPAERLFFICSFCFSRDAFSTFKVRISSSWSSHLSRSFCASLSALPSRSFCLLLSLIAASRTAVILS